MIETHCRITQVTDPTLLIASHIKPWRDSNDQEKLDGNNGLLLSPHVDKLFDRGFISFSDQGALLISDQLDRSVLNRWHIAPDQSVGAFSEAQCAYLAFHRDGVFMGEGEA